MNNVVGFVSTLEYLLQMVSDIKAVVSVLILQQLGLTSLGDLTTAL